MVGCEVVIQILTLPNGTSSGIQRGLARQWTAGVLFDRVRVRVPSFGLSTSTKTRGF